MADVNVEDPVPETANYNDDAAVVKGTPKESETYRARSRVVLISIGVLGMACAAVFLGLYFGLTSTSNADEKHDTVANTVVNEEDGEQPQVSSSSSSKAPTQAEVTDEEGLCVNGTEMVFPKRPLQLSDDGPTPCENLNDSNLTASFDETVVPLLRDACGCPGASYGVLWCDTCSKVLGFEECDSSYYDATCMDFEGHMKPIERSVLESGYTEWYQTHGTVDWNMWPVPLFRTDFTEPWMEYRAYQFTTDMDCCKYSSPGPQRDACSEMVNHTYALYMPYGNHTGAFGPMLDYYSVTYLSQGEEEDEEDTMRTFGAGQIVKTTVLEQSEDGNAILVDICVEAQPFPYNWGPNFNIWARDWNNVSAALVEEWNGRIQEITGNPDIEFLETLPPLDPDYPYDEFYGHRPLF